MNLTYADTGVDRDTRETAKKVFEGFTSTYSLAKYGKPIKTPFNMVYKTRDGYQVKTCDGVGTKVLIAELAGKHDTIGIDAIAMVANDCVRCGAEPLAITDVIDIKKSEPGILNELQKGLNEGARQSNAPLIGGETADVPELMKTLYHINCDCVGEVEKGSIITGEKVRDGDAVVGMRSSGVHSNGISLVRRALFTEWGGKYDANENRELLLQALEPTKIYVKPLLKAFNDFDVHAAVHITGDAYLKFLKLGVGFEFNNFKPHDIFAKIQEAGNVADEEMFRTFNMGWGFALVVDKSDADSVAQAVGGEVIGKATDEKRSVVEHNGKRMVL